MAADIPAVPQKADHFGLGKNNRKFLRATDTGERKIKFAKMHRLTITAETVNRVLEIAHTR